MKIRVTVLSENSVFSNLGAIAEHGWSVFLETKHGNFLFDTGQGKALLNNANVFRKDLSSIQGIILSHHHIDHTGGLLDAVKITATKPVDVYAHPGLFNEGYLARSGYKYIGVPFCRAALESAGAKFKFNTEFTEIIPGLYLTGEIPRVTPYEQGDDDMLLKTANGFVKDKVWDDQSIVIKTAQGLLVILGCAHAGIINILTYAQQKTGENRIYAVIGGTHLWSVSREQKEKSLEALTDMGIGRLGVSHCTGFEMSMRLAQLFGEKFFNCNVGTVIEV
ncbi:MBL fold metallo-hydrolase [Sporomusa acidovorans]|uniref:Metallo-beta-lactamase domain-containing protein n=1 Tax=Sporomusa acidovorans (strain ATCC 49682 / DSM 3132 / Mol) TaxID=1123286 RepID=A0ABZ3IYM1_SPOA4|nr:MBL fold metallo-hydrolase [Sporomusa acidovorans]OZC17717.1 ribonuclease Z [Sporomusa acidovorans DSM 3132]SDE12916.1 7,8-dihydropterin-6-yl-methyl-4-(beta-D-ribofuranosyl)aminobenzene 5'-phosphate synthase [Sporomusa acidovorans]